MVGRLEKIVGLLLILFGLWGGLLNHGFGSMINPAVSDLEWWQQYLRSTWQGFLFSFGMLFAGGFLLFGPPNRWRRKRWTPIVEPVHFLLIDREKTIHPPDADLS
jgi:hypothetical protein